MGCPQQPKAKARQTPLWGVCLAFYLLFSSCDCPNLGGANGAPAGGAFLVDIPEGVESEVRGLDELRLLIFL